GSFKPALRPLDSILSANEWEGVIDHYRPRRSIVFLCIAWFQKCDLHFSLLFVLARETQDPRVSSSCCEYCSLRALFFHRVRTNRRTKGRPMVDGAGFLVRLIFLPTSHAT
ncbi:unnamed protein product, partial [Phaeothamnion confervicola]